MSLLRKSLIGAGLGCAALALTAAPAAAAIVCSGDVCWHTHETYEYPSTAHVIVHPDTWHWGPNEHYTFREHEGRGYWSGDRWTEW